MQPNQRGLPKLPKGATTIVSWGAAALVAFLGYATLEGPLATWRTDLARRADLVRGKLADSGDIRRDHREKEQLLQELLARVDDVNRRIPDEPREGEFLADLSRLAQRHGFAIEDFRRGATQSTDTHSVVSVTVTGRAPHAALCSLIEQVARMPRLVELRSLEVEQDDRDAGYPVEMTYALYYGMSTTTPAEGP